PQLCTADWLADDRFLRAGGQTAGDLLARKSATVPALVHVQPDEPVRAVLSVLREFGVSQVPVVKAEPPLVLAEVMGAVQDRELMDRAFADPTILDRPIAEVMGPALPTLGSGEAVEMAVARLETAPAVLVLDAGHPVGILSRSDVLE